MQLFSTVTSVVQNILHDSPLSITIIAKSWFIIQTVSQSSLNLHNYRGFSSLVVNKHSTGCVSFPLCTYFNFCEITNCIFSSWCCIVISAAFGINVPVFNQSEPFCLHCRDLSFSKGDVIFLKKKLDDNWYVGEVNGQTGFFPANHVEVIHPLQDVVPSCKALYDFEVAQNREKDILTFNKVRCKNQSSASLLHNKPIERTLAYTVTFIRPWFFSLCKNLFLFLDSFSFVTDSPVASFQRLSQEFAGEGWGLCQEGERGMWHDKQVFVHWKQVISLTTVTSPTNWEVPQFLKKAVEIGNENRS